MYGWYGCECVIIIHTLHNVYYVPWMKKTKVPKYAWNECKQKWLPGGQILLLRFRCLCCSTFVLLLSVTFSILDFNFGADCIVAWKSPDDVDSCWDDMFWDDLCCVVELIFTVNCMKIISVGKHRASLIHFNFKANEKFKLPFLTIW